MDKLRKKFKSQKSEDKQPLVSNSPEKTTVTSNDYQQLTNKDDNNNTNTDNSKNSTNKGWG